MNVAMANMNSFSATMGHIQKPMKEIIITNITGEMKEETGDLRMYTRAANPVSSSHKSCPNEFEDIRLRCLRSMFAAFGRQ